MQSSNKKIKGKRNEKTKKTKAKNKKEISIEKEILENRKEIKQEEIEIINPKQKFKLYKKKFNSLKIKYKKDLKKFAMIVSSFLIVVSLVIGTSNAALSYLSKTNNTTKIESGTIALELKNESNSITLSGALPQEDNDAILNNEEYEFTIENTGSVSSNYIVSLSNTCTTETSYIINEEEIIPDKCVPNEYIKVGLKKGSEEYKVLEYDQEKNKYILEADYLEPNEIIDYKMKIWLDYDTPNDYNPKDIYNIIYLGQLEIEYEQTIDDYTDNTYHIVYNANGGEGQMENSVHKYGEKKSLSKNTYTREGYTFKGWSIQEKSDIVIYEDEEQVQNLITKDQGIVNLYAVWIESNYKIEYYTSDGTTKLGESEHTYNVAKQLTTMSVLGESATNSTMTFYGWSTSINGEEVSYTDGESVKNLATTSGEIVKLYSVWGLKRKNVTIKIAYNTSTYSGPSTYLLPITPLSKTQTTLTYGTSEEITSTPAEPADRYTGSVSCTNEITASITQGTGTTTRTDTVTISNNSETQTDSVCTITYTPKWEGVAYGTYTAGATNVSYAGKTWTVKADNGNNTGLVLNGVTSTGAYATNVQSTLNNSTVNNDVTNGGLIAQSSGIYVTTNGGISTGYTGANYWTSPTTFYNNTVRNLWTRSSSQYIYGINNRGTYTTTLREMTETTLYTTCTSTSVNAAVGIISTTSASNTYSVSGGTVTFQRASCPATAGTSMYSQYGRYFKFGSGSTNKMNSDWTEYKYNGSAWTTYDSGSLATTYRYRFFACGGLYDGKRIVYQNKNSSTFYYANEGSQEGWPSGQENFSTSTANTYEYDWYAEFAGYATTDCSTSSNCSSKEIDGYTRYFRTYKLRTAGQCSTRTTYSYANASASIYYRPYIIVRER